MEGGYAIADVAERTGFSASTLRYYEDIGLLPAPERTAAGYRVYDDTAVARLRFIARTKQLGCTLQEITDLVRAWEGDRCATVSAQLRALVASKLDDNADRIAELMVLTNELQHAATLLATPIEDGPCNETCVCVTPDGSDDAPIAVSPSARVPIACTLNVNERPQRLENWQRVLASVGNREPLEGGVRLTFERGVDLTELTRLVASEHSCCRFFDFAVTVDGRGVGLEVRAPDDAQAVVHALFGAAA
jgi:MerR family copper efflux transcriptional regulator